jgi:penicillin-binding protein 2
MVAAAALQEKIITRYTSVQSVGGIWIDKWFFPDWTAGGHGSTNVTKAIAWSVNTFFYYVGGGYKEFKGLGVEKLKEYFQKFGLGQKTGIDIYGEQPGFVPSPEWKEQEKNEMWYIGDTYNLSIGQGDLLVTPLQVANWTATIVNGGHVYVPHLLKSIIDPVKKTRDEILPKITNENFISPENLAIVKQGMGECVNYGSCRSLLSLPFTTGGKSGTAQWNSTKENHGWFTAFAPYNNPQIVVTVIVEEGEGGTLSAAPVVKEFLAWWGKGRY